MRVPARAREKLQLGRVLAIALALFAALALATPAFSQDADTDLFGEEANDSDLFGEDLDDDDLFDEGAGDAELLDGEAAAEESSDAEGGYRELSGKAFDLVVVRPLGVSRILVGFVAFIPAAIFAELPPFLGGDAERWRANVSDVWRFFVMETVDATFTVPLGEFTEAY